MSKPRIYVAITNFHPQVGGAERQALAHARSLIERGHEATIVTLRHQRAWPRHDVIDRVPVIRVAGNILNNREVLPGPLRKMAYVFGLFALAGTLWRHRRRYDVLCVYQLGLLVLPAVLICLLTGKPMVVGLRSADSGMRTSGRKRASRPALPSEGDLVQSSMEAWNREVSDVQALDRLPSPIRRSMLHLFRRTHAVLVVLSSRMRAEVAAYGIGLPMLHIPNGVDVARFAPRCSDADKRSQTVVCVTRLAYSKGVDVLLRAWQLVHERAPRARLIIVGRGPLRDQLESLAKDLGVASTVEFAGLQDDVAAQLHRGGLAVLASRWEGMPNAVLEAMACGLPCVATRVSGSEDIIQHGRNGLLVEPEDSEALAQALLTLLGNTELVQEFGRAARDTVERHYSNERVTDMYVALYEQLVNGARPVEGFRLQQEDCEL